MCAIFTNFRSGILIFQILNLIFNCIKTMADEEENPDVGEEEEVILKNILKQEQITEGLSQIAKTHGNFFYCITCFCFRRIVSCLR